MQALENYFIYTAINREFSVAELSLRIKELLESNIGYVKVRGEISGLKTAGSGHCYFNLKDKDNPSALLAITCWKHSLTKVKFSLVDGLEVSIAGKITSYSGQSRYQLSAELIEPVGSGAWKQILKERQEKLEKEGLFDKSLKKPIPKKIASRIGIVTSITGAVIRDIIHRVQERCPTSLIIWPVTVQGENAAEEISAAISGLNALIENKPDIIIVARGGGSIEDLAPFNEEIVVRSTAASAIPIISAVGHETDTTLIDLAADLRAPTPTAAAEYALPVAANLLSCLELNYSRLVSNAQRLVTTSQRTLDSYQRISRYFINYFTSIEQRLDDLGFRLSESLPTLFKLKKIKLERFSAQQFNPNKAVSYKLMQVVHCYGGLVRLIDKITASSAHKLDLNTALLKSLDYNNALKRGFAIVKSAEGRFLSSKALADTDVGDKLKIQFADGELVVKKM